MCIYLFIGIDWEREREVPLSLKKTFQEKRRLCMTDGQREKCGRRANKNRPPEEREEISTIYLSPDSLVREVLQWERERESGEHLSLSVYTISRPLYIPLYLETESAFLFTSNIHIAMSREVVWSIGLPMYMNVREYLRRCLECFSHRAVCTAEEYEVVKTSHHHEEERKTKGKKKCL